MVDVMTTENIVIGLYIRCSTDKQDIRTQKRALLDYCKKNLYPDNEIILFVDEATSGVKQDRPSLNRLMKAAENGEVNKIVVFELSRISRDMMHLLRTMEKFEKLGIVLETPSEGPVPFDNSMSRFLVAAKSLVAAEERELISRRTKAALAERKFAGIKLGARPGSQHRKGKLKDYRESEPELVDRVVHFSRKGFSTRDIALAIGCSADKVQRVLRRCGNS
jgi:DNA invertase Pin-like site-specific DNA recombinase